MILSDKELLARLVGFDTTSTNSNLPIADFICEYLDRPGITVTRNPSEDGNKVNLLVMAGGDRADEDRDGLVLCGHLDVVPVKEAGWKTDPFTLTEVDGTYVGRGACDMKASVALAVNALASIEVDTLTRPLAGLFTYDEELGSLGAQRFADTWSDPLPTSVLVGEPTSLRAVRMHKGHLTMRLSVRGKAAHSGSPHLGSNAIEAAARVIQAIARLTGPLKHQRVDSSQYFPTVPFPVINIGTISGGQAVNVVPDHCDVELGVRVLPGMNVHAMIELIRDTVAKTEPQGNIGVEVIKNNPPLLLDAKAQIHTVLTRLLDQRQSYGVSYASDGGVLQGMSLECVLFGPGSIEVAHRANEYLPINEFERAREVVGQLVEHFCLAGD